MKSVLISIQPKWCELIADGRKTVEVRKSAPKEVPFKAYLYCTNGRFDITDIDDLTSESVRVVSEGRGKVIGEFICDRVDKFSCKCIPRQGIAFGYERFIKDGVYLLNNNDTDYVVFERQDKYLDTMLKNADLAAMCLTPRELFQYAGGFGKPLYAWHISDLKIYDTPRALGEFRTPDKSYHEIIERDGCLMFMDGYESGKPLKRAPQSWQYVEEDEVIEKAWRWQGYVTDKFPIIKCYDVVSHKIVKGENPDER